jgi:myo-inositol-1(or 4)-monophosphatase
VRTSSVLSSGAKKKFTKVALQAAEAAGTVLNKYLLGRAANSQWLKARNDLVTTADLESCRVIKKHLKLAFPGHSFLFEEAEFTEDNHSDYLWIIDPLDGTTFHHRGLPFFSIIVALQVKDAIEFGLAYAPFSNDLFISWRGGGSFHWNRRFRIHRHLRVSKVKRLGEAIIGYSHGKSEAHVEEISLTLRKLLPACRAFTRIAGADIGYVAGGCCDAFIDNSSSPWDFAAMALMVREAGGKVTDYSGRDWNLGSKSILASNKVLHSQILEFLTGNRSAELE